MQIMKNHVVVFLNNRRAYDDLNISILEKILSHHLVDFEDFYRVILSWVEGLKA